MFVGIFLIIVGLYSLYHEYKDKTGCGCLGVLLGLLLLLAIFLYHSI